MFSTTPRRRVRDGLWAAGFLAPAVILLLALRIWPAVVAGRDSLYRTAPGRQRSDRFVGLDNYVDVLGSGQFWNSVRQTLLFNVLAGPITMIGALGLAYLLTRRVRFTAVWRTLAFLPCALPLVGATAVWSVLLRPDGWVNGLLSSMGLPEGRWFTSPGSVLWTLALITAWSAAGYWMLFLIAGLNEIPGDVYEAARLDGAHAGRIFFSITLPLLRRPLLFVLVASTVWNFVVYAPIQVVTGGGPDGASNVLMYDITHKYYGLNLTGQAMAEMVLLFVLMGAIVVTQFLLLRSKDDS